MYMTVPVSWVCPHVGLISCTFLLYDNLETLQTVQFLVCTKICVVSSPVQWPEVYII